MSGLWASKYLDFVLLGLHASVSVLGLLAIKSAFLDLRAAGGAWLGESGALIRLGGGACLYIASFLVWMVVLSRLPLAVAYPVSIGLTLSFSTLGAALLLDEHLDVVRVLGIALIFSGVVCVTWRVNGS